MAQWRREKGKEKDFCKQVQVQIVSAKSVADRTLYGRPVLDGAAQRSFCSCR